jgi:CRP/FNR family transcriptional regulator
MDAFRASLSAHMPGNTACERTLDRLCEVGQSRSLLCGHEIRGHRHRDRIIFITGGAAKLIAATPSARIAQDSASAVADNSSVRLPHILAFHFPGDFVFVVNEAAGDLRLAALTDLDLVAFSSEQFLRVAQDDPAIIRIILSRSVQALHRSQTKMIEIGHKSACQRMAGFLVAMAERIGGCTSGACQFSLPMTRTDIADSLGLTIETVSRQLASLNKAELIETNGRNGLRISDISKLKLEAG